MAENLVKRTVAFQTHCNSCDNDTIHLDLGDFITCSVCRVSELTYVVKREGRLTEIAPPTKEKSNAPSVTTRDKAANPKELLAKV